MKDYNTTTHDIRLIVVGASGRIGREVARLGVGYGALVYGVCRDGRAPNDEPWTQGVTWLARDVTVGGALDELDVCPIVVAAPIDVPRQLVERFDRVVIVEREGVALSASALADGVIVASPGPIDDTPWDSAIELSAAHGVRVETVAMALLRAALDESLPHRLGPDEIAHFGDAVMLQ